MQIDTPGIVTVAVPSDLSAEGVADFYRRLDEILDTGPTALEIDSSEWQHVTSSQIHVLWRTYQSCSGKGVQMRLKSPSPGLVRVLKVLDLYDVLAGVQDLYVPDLNRTVHVDLGDGTYSYADKFSADADSVNSALDDFIQFLGRLHIPQATKFELRTLFYEVVTNIRCHGQLDSSSLVVFACKVDGRKISMVFGDSGQPFDPTSSKADVDVLSAARDRKVRGFGIMMMRKMTDRLSYVRKENSINVLTLEKEWDVEP